VANLGVASSGTLVSTLTAPIEAQINAALAQVPLSSVNLSGNSQVSAALTIAGMLILGISGGYAQSNLASVSGVVSDPQGAVVPAAAISVISFFKIASAKVS